MTIATPHLFTSEIDKNMSICASGIGYNTGCQRP